MSEEVTMNSNQRNTKSHDGDHSTLDGSESSKGTLLEGTFWNGIHGTNLATIIFGCHATCCAE